MLYQNPADILIYTGIVISQANWRWQSGGSRWWRHALPRHSPGVILNTFVSDKSQSRVLVDRGQFFFSLLRGGLRLTLRHLHLPHLLARLVHKFGREDDRPVERDGKAAVSAAQHDGICVYYSRGVEGGGKTTYRQRRW